LSDGREVRYRRQTDGSFFPGERKALLVRGEG